jgi:hypothetical protein
LHRIPRTFDQSDFTGGHNNEVKGQIGLKLIHNRSDYGEISTFFLSQIIGYRFLSGLNYIKTSYMRKYIMILLLALPLFLPAQSPVRHYMGLAVMNTQTDLPFGKFTGMFYKAFHPGIEFSYGKNFSIKARHDWYYDFRLAYFYHRFVQHGIPLYSNLGYRYKFNQRWSASGELGAGYLHSIPATAKFGLNGEGVYENDKGIGRMQVNTCFAIGAGYLLNPSVPSSLKLFIIYQQRLQMPFVKSYVPVLPYNSIMIGIAKPVIRKKLNHQ